VTVAVTADAGYSIGTVTASNGTITGTGPYTLLNVTGDTTVTATFTANTNSVAYAADPPAGGTVTGPTTILTGATAPVTLATNAGYTLSALTVSNGNVTSTAPYVLSNVTEGTTVTATFAANINTVSYGAAPSEGGSVTGPATILTGGTATVTVTANPGYGIGAVAATNGNITASAPYVLTGVTGNSTVTATFTQQTVVVPNVIGQTQERAEATLQTAGLVVGGLADESSNTVPAGQVLRQSPAAGMVVLPGTTVDLVISSGPENKRGCNSCQTQKGEPSIHLLPKILGELFLPRLSLLLLAFKSSR